MIDASPGRRPLKYEHITNLMRLFDIPEARRAFFARMLETSIREAWRAAGKYRGIPRAPRICALLQRARRTTPSKALALLSRPEPHSEAAASILGAVTLAEDLENWLLTTPKEEAEPAFDRAAELARVHFRGRGRSPGAGRNPAFDGFVQQLYFYVRAAGGNPGAASKKGASPVVGKFFTPSGRNRGAIVRLLNSGQLPNGLVPTTENSKLEAFKKAERAYSKVYT